MWIKILQIIISVLMMMAILFQNKGTAVSGIFGGNGGNVYSTKRGFDKFLVGATIVLAVIFFGLSLFSLVDFS
jgi:protein translocase SecG subunit